MASPLVAIILGIAFFGFLLTLYASWKGKAFSAVTTGTIIEPDTTDSQKSYPRTNQLRLLRDYHRQGLAQSKISFWFSLSFAALGFLVILFALVGTKTEATRYQSYVAIISGTIIDAVAALFFVQSNKAREQMAAFFDKLRTDQKLQDGLKLSEGIADEVLRNKVQTILALNLSESRVTETMITSILSSEVRQRSRETPSGSNQAAD